MTTLFLLKKKQQKTSKSKSQQRKQSSNPQQRKHSRKSIKSTMNHVMSATIRMATQMTPSRQRSGFLVQSVPIGSMKAVQRTMGWLTTTMPLHVKVACSQKCSNHLLSFVLIRCCLLNLVCLIHCCLWYCYRTVKYTSCLLTLKYTYLFTYLWIYFMSS